MRGLACVVIVAFATVPPLAVGQVVHGKPYDNKSDIWALGCVLYEMCALCKPFDASNIPGIIMKIVRANPRCVHVGAVLLQGHGWGLWLTALCRTAFFWWP